MPKFLKFASILFGSLLFTVSCGGDDDEDTGVKPPGNEPVVVNCKNPYHTTTQAELAAATTGACQDDIGAVCSNDMIKLSSDCGKGCFIMSMEPAEHAACTQACLEAQAKPAPSEGCTACYIQSVQCVAANCLEVCLADGTAAPCQACRIEKGCSEAFYTCSGLPQPTAEGGI